MQITNCFSFVHPQGFEPWPKKNPDAKRYDRVSYMEVLSKGLNVMDSTATSLCMDNDVPMIVFDLTVKGNISRALKGEDVGTTVESQ